MAGFCNIEVKREYRPCLLISKNETKKALFHTWEQNSQIIPPSPLAGGHGGGVISGVIGIVELENGEVIRVQPYQIQFLDNKIQEYAFPPDGSSHTENDNNKPSMLNTFLKDSYE